MANIINYEKTFIAALLFAYLKSKMSFNFIFLKP